MAINPTRAADCKRYRERHPERIKANKKKQVITDEQKARYAAAQAARREENPERVKAIKKASYLRNKASSRNNNLKYKYGITLETFNQMLADQNGVCAICRKPSAKSYHCDHDHKTGVVRGVLCHWCNTSLGWFEANKIAANQYLEKHS